MLENLQSLHRHEEELRAQSLTSVAADTTLTDHIEAAQDALDQLVTLQRIASTPGSDPHTTQLLAMRLFNIGASTLKLGLSGYYQQAFQLLRDSLELVNLLDLFRADRSKLSLWRLADNQTLKKQFGPAAVRSALEVHPEYQGQKAGRDRLYSVFSEHAAHVTYKGFSLIAPGNSPRLGPFFDAKLLRALLEDLGRHLAHATLAVASLLDDDIEPTVLASRNAYLSKLVRYYEKYIKPTGSPR